MQSLPYDILWKVCEFAKEPSIIQVNKNFLESVKTNIKSIIYYPKSDNDCLPRILLNINKLTLCGIHAQSSMKYIHERFTSLYELHFQYTSIHDISSLRHCKNLRYLNIGSSSVEDTSPLIDLKHLHTLILSGSMGKSYDINIEKLSQLSQLEELEISFVSSLSSIIAPYNVKRLELYFCNNLTNISCCSKIEKMSLSFTKVSDITFLSKLVHLQILSLANTPITDISHVSHCTNLKELILNDTNIEDIRPISQCKKLEVLGIRDTQVSDIRPLIQCPELRDIDLRCMSNIGDLTPLLQCRKLEMIRPYKVDITKVKNLYYDKNEVHYVEFTII